MTWFMWTKITHNEYLETYTADYKIVSSTLEKGGKYGRFLEVILGINNKPLLKHAPTFDFMNVLPQTNGQLLELRSKTPSRVSKY